FKNGTSEVGLFCEEGRLRFHIDFANDIVANNTTITPNAFVQVVFTRNSAGNVAGYVNGVRQITFTESSATSSSGVALIEGNTLRFFRTHATGVGASAGQIARLRLYNDALSSDQVAALDRLPNIQNGCPSVSGLNLLSGSGAPGSTFNIN